jgi:chromosome segregation ATPase
MSSHEDLERRVSQVEAELSVVRQETAAARALAAGADRDVAEYRAELRGHTRVLSALRETQLEHDAELKADVGGLKADVSSLKAGMAEVRSGVALIVRLLEGPPARERPDRAEPRPMG